MEPFPTAVLDAFPDQVMDSISRDVAQNGSMGVAAGIAAGLAPIDDRQQPGSRSIDVPAHLLGALFDQLDHGVVVQDASGWLVAANAAARAMLGIAGDAIRRSTPAIRWRVVDERGVPLPDDLHPSMLALRTGHAVHGRLLGVLPQGFDEPRWLRVSAHPYAGAHAIGGAAEPAMVLTIFTDVTEEVEGARADRFVADVAARLLASLDLDETLAGLTSMVVPYLADWCAVDLCDGEGRDTAVRRVGVYHADPAMRQLAMELQERYPPRLDDAHGVGAVIRTGRTEVVPQISDDLLAAATRDAEHLRLARALGLRAYVIAPLTADGRTLGAITLVSSETRRRLDTPRTLATVRDVAHRAAMALAHARQVRAIRDEVERRARAEDSLRLANHDLDVQRQQLEEQAVELEVSNQQLQEQQIELETINEQLQEQQVELEATNQQLQEQQVELETINEQLQENAHALQERTDELEVATEHLARQARELDEQRLRAEEANAAKSQFLAAMSHELRTPLNAITGYVDLLAMGIRGSVTEAQQEDLSRIKRSGDHLLRLINDILQFAKLEAGQLQFRLVDVPLDAALRELEELVQPQMRAKRLSFGFSVSAEHPVARADRDKVQQVVLNLLSNAIKATPPGGSVRVEAASLPEAQLAVVRVHDTGVGIPASKLVTIFDPFVQVDRQLNRPGEGIGLGLAISRDLARTMGGDLTVESTPGKGSTFTLVLPLA